MCANHIKASRKRACQIRPRPRTGGIQGINKMRLLSCFCGIYSITLRLFWKPGAHGKPIGCIALGKLGYRFKKRWKLTVPHLPHKTAMNMCLVEFSRSMHFVPPEVYHHTTQPQGENIPKRSVKHVQNTCAEKTSWRRRKYEHRRKRKSQAWNKVRAPVQENLMGLIAEPASPMPSVNMNFIAPPAPPPPYPTPAPSPRLSYNLMALPRAP
jgi:hypothetical protein